MQLSASKYELASLRTQRGKCPFTARQLTCENAQLDHIVPFIAGGSGHISNLRWVHRDVNYAKRDPTDVEFATLCKRVAQTANQLEDHKCLIQFLPYCLQRNKIGH